jgi:cell wall-associated NlpC family hydrolase
VSVSDAISRITAIQSEIASITPSAVPTTISPTAFSQLLGQQLTSQPTTTPTTASTGSLGEPTPYDAMIQQVAAETGTPAALIKAVCKAESGFDPNSVSSAGAEGLMQLMPSTAAGLGVTNPLDPYQSLLGGAKDLRGLLDKYGGDLTKTIAAYNAGSGAVDRYGGIPPYPETQAYVPRVLGYMQQYQETAATPQPTAITASSPLSSALYAAPLTPTAATTTTTAPTALLSEALNAINAGNLASIAPLLDSSQQDPSAASTTGSDQQLLASLTAASGASTAASATTPTSTFSSTFSSDFAPLDPAALQLAATPATATTTNGSLTASSGVSPESLAGIGMVGGTGVGARVVTQGLSYLGVPYQWGGESPTTGFDCSGLCQYLYAQQGVQIPRTSEQQFQAGVAVAAAQLQPGDLVFFRENGDVHHVGIYLGNGKFIEAPHTGAVVRIASLSEPYYAAEFCGARRYA